MEERREILRTEYDVPGVVVLIDEQKAIPVKVANISPLGMGALIDKVHEDMEGKEIIIIADCVLMNAVVTRVAEHDAEHNIIGVKGTSFDPDTLQYLFERIGGGE